MPEVPRVGRAVGLHARRARPDPAGLHGARGRRTWRAWTLAAKSYESADGTYDDDGDRAGTIRSTARWRATWIAPRRRERPPCSASRHVHATARATWTSFYATARRWPRAATCTTCRRGAWRFYHESGNLAAEGKLADGVRTGNWHFYYDTSAKTPIATGKFRASGYVDGHVEALRHQGRAARDVERRRHSGRLEARRGSREPVATDVVLAHDHPRQGRHRAPRPSGRDQR